jgi:hypothetical protein
MMLVSPESSLNVIRSHFYQAEIWFNQSIAGGFSGYYSEALKLVLIFGPFSFSSTFKE